MTENDEVKLMKTEKVPVNLRKSRRIYDYIKALDSVSKQDIVIGLKLSLPTVTQNLQYLTELALVDKSQKIQSTGGRSATAYTFIKNARIAIGVFLDASHITVVGVDLSGTVVEMEKQNVNFDLSDDKYLRQLGDLVEVVRKRSGVDAENLLGVGIAVKGFVSKDGEEVTYDLTHNFTGATRKQIAKYIPYKNRLFHDSEVGGFAEVWGDENILDAFYINLSNNIGGAVIINNEIYSCDSCKSGEVGHMVAVTKGGKQCYCGKYGCFDTVCRATNLSDYTGGSLERFFILLEGGDKKAYEMWNAYLEDLSLAIHNVRMLFNLPIIIGGYVGAFIGAYMDKLCALVDERNPFGERSKDYLLPCKHKADASAMGSAISYIDWFFDTI